MNVAELVKWAKGSGVGYSSVQELCENEAAVAAVTKDLNSIGKGKLGANEMLASIVLLSGEGDPEAQDLDSPWTPENQVRLRVTGQEGGRRVEGVRVSAQGQGSSLAHSQPLNCSNRSTAQPFSTAQPVATAEPLATARPPNRPTRRLASQFLTASNKLNRKPIEKGFDKLLKPLIQKGIR